MAQRKPPAPPTVGNHEQDRPIDDLVIHRVVLVNFIESLVGGYPPPLVKQEQVKLTPKEKALLYLLAVAVINYPHSRWVTVDQILAWLYGNAYKLVSPSVPRKDGSWTVEQIKKPLTYEEKLDRLHNLICDIRAKIRVVHNCNLIEYGSNQRGEPAYRLTTFEQCECKPGYITR